MGIENSVSNDFDLINVFDCYLSIVFLDISLRIK